MDPKETESQVEKKNRRMRAAKESANLKMKINLRNENSPRIIEQNDDIGEKNDDLTGDLLDDDGKSIIEIDEDAAALNKEITNHFENKVTNDENFCLNESYQWDEDDVFSRTFKEIRKMPTTQKKSILSKLENLIQESNSGNSLHRRESLESSNSNQHFFDKKRQRERISSVPEGYRPPNFYNQGPPNDSYYQWLMHQQMMHQFNPNIPLAERYDEKEPFTEFAIRFRTKLRFIYIPEAFLKDYLKLHLSGRPLRECNDNDDLDFEETMQFLTRNFRGSLSADSAYRRIKLIKCTDPRDFEKYCKEIDNLCNIAYADESRKRLLERKKHHILDLLPENLRIILKYSNLINTVEDLIVAGKDVWRVNKFQKKDESVREGHKDETKPTRICSYCGKLNHDEKVCRNKLRDEQKKEMGPTTTTNSCIIDEIPPITSESTKLPCIQVELNDSIKTIALIDSGSQRTILPYVLAQELEVKLSDDESRCVTFNNQATNLKKAKDSIQIKLSKDYNVIVTPLVASADVIIPSEIKFVPNKNSIKIKDDSEIPLIYPCIPDEPCKNKNFTYIYSIKVNDTNSKDEFIKLIESKYPNLISKSKFDAGPGKYVCAESRIIQSREAVKPIRIKNNVSNENELISIIKEMEQAKIITRSNTRYVHPFFLVKKADGISSRVVGDFRSINSIIHPIYYETKPPHQLIMELAGNKLFTVIDLANAYYLLSIPKQGYYGINTPLGVYEFIRLPQGARNSASEFQRFINELLHHHTYAQAYLDDIIIYEPTGNKQKHLEEVMKVLETLNQAQLRIDPRKIQYMGTEVQFLGFTINEQGSYPSRKSIDRLLNRKKPSSKSELIGFVNAASYFRKYIPNFTNLVNVLIEASKGGTQKKKKDLEWTSEMEKSYEDIKKKMEEHNLLYAFNPNLDLYITTDSSDLAAGAYASQYIEDEEVPICFFSKKLPETVKKRNSTFLEAKGIIMAIKEFEGMIIATKGKRIVRTDHKPLLSLVKTNNEPKYFDLVEIIEKHGIILEYHAGASNMLADDLSRNYEERSYVNFIADPDGALFPKLTRNDQEEDIETLNNLKLNVKIPEDKEQLILVQISNKKDGQENWVPYIPKEKVNIVLKFAHDFYGHQNRTKVTDLLLNRCYFIGMREEIKKYTENCNACLSKDSSFHRKPLIYQTVEFNAPMECLCIDAVGPLPLSNSKMKYIIGVLDSFSRYLILFPTDNLQHDNLLPLLYKYVFNRIGIPKILHSDNGKSFKNKKWDEALKKLNCTPSTGTPHHHNSNTLVERSFRTLQSILGKLLIQFKKDAKTQWTELLTTAEFMYNITPNQTTKASPYFIFFGREPRSQLEHFLNLSNSYCESTNSEIMRNTAKMYEIIRDTISSERQKAVDYQIKTGNIMNETNLRKGTLIMIQRGKSSKFDSEFIGPTEVILDNGDSVQIRHPETKRLTTVHKEQIKLLKNQSQAQMGE
uniref:RNA-directed DNA polymerase n=1 Tax=Strongyloides papillosus TaxID=174720 RepID=A0A0N5B248_STREA